jgi:hypothetical protein
VAEEIENTRTQNSSQMAQKQLNSGLAIEIKNTVLETREIQKETILEIEKQGELLNRLEHKLDNIEDNLKRADHLVKGIDSVSYYMFGKSYTSPPSKPPKKGNTSILSDPSKSSSPLIKIEALFKHGDDLDPCIIVFQPSQFLILNPKTEKLLKKKETQYLYNDISQITIEPKKSEYFHISFNTNKSPIQLCSAYRQILINQLYNRNLKEGYEVPVKFEKGSSGFDYKDEWIYKIQPMYSRENGKRLNDNLSSLFTTKENQVAANIIDECCDVVIKELDDIITDGINVNHTLKEQTIQVENLSIKTDNINETMKTLGVKMDKQG